MNFGLSPEERTFILNTVVKPLKGKNAIVWCFGSRARGDHRQFSDLDLLIDAPNLNQETLLSISQIEETLINSNFPYKVDLVLLKNLAENYSKKILSEKVLFA